MPPTDSPGSAPPASRPRTLRVTIAFDGDDLRIQSVEPVAMIAPPAVGVPPREGQSGYWLEVQGEDGRVLFHRPLHNPMGGDVESFADDGQSITRHAMARPHGTFEVLVPDLGDARTLRIMGADAATRAIGPKAAPARSRPLVSATFDELRQAPAPARTEPR